MGLEGFGDPGGSETGRIRCHSRVEQVAQEILCAGEGGEDAGDPTHAAEQAGREVVGDALEVDAGLFVQFGERAPGG